MRAMTLSKSFSNASAGDATEPLVGPERRERELIVNLQLPIVDLNRAARKLKRWAAQLRRMQDGTCLSR